MRKQSKILEFWNSDFGYGVPVVECIRKSDSTLKRKLLFEVGFLYINSFLKSN